MPSSLFPPSIAPTTTETAVVVASSLGMASTANASVVWRSDAMRQAIEEGIADCSAYVRGDGVALTAVADSTGRRRRRAARALSQASYDLDVDFEMTVIGAAYGYEDSDLDDLVAAIETNLTAHVNSGGLDASV